MKLRVVPINDASNLQELVLRQIDLIDGEIQILEIGVNTEWGPVILALDQEGRLVILVSTIIQEDFLLSRFIGLYGWVSKNMGLLSRFYSKRGLDSTRSPRVISVSPGYSNTIREGISFLTFTVELYTWRGLEVNGERTVLLERLGGPASSPKLAEGYEPPSVLLKASQLSDAEIRYFKQSNSSAPSS